MQVIDLQLRHDDEEQISLSWHLTALERKRVLRTINSVENRSAFEQLLNALQPDGVPTLAARDSAPGPAADRVPLP
jgi:hypothetical protein